MNSEDAPIGTAVDNLILANHVPAEQPAVTATRWNDLDTASAHAHDIDQPPHDDILQRDALDLHLGYANAPLIEAMPDSAAPSSPVPREYMEVNTVFPPPVSPRPRRKLSFLGSLPDAPSDDDDDDDDDDHRQGQADTLGTAADNARGDVTWGTASRVRRPPSPPLRPPAHVFSLSSRLQVSGVSPYAGAAAPHAGVDGGGTGLRLMHAPADPMVPPLTPPSGSLEDRAPLEDQLLRLGAMLIDDSDPADVKPPVASAVLPHVHRSTGGSTAAPIYPLARVNDQNGTPTSLTPTSSHSFSPEPSDDAAPAVGDSKCIETGLLAAQQRTDAYLGDLYLVRAFSDAPVHGMVNFFFTCIFESIFCSQICKLSCADQSKPCYGSEFQW